MAERMELTVNDLKESMEEGFDQGWWHGYLTARLGSDWPNTYLEGTEEIMRMYIRCVRGEAMSARKKYEKGIRLKGTAVMLDMAFKDCKEICKDEETS